MKKIYTIAFIALLCLANVQISNAQKQKRVLLEEMSTALCSFCPVKSIDAARFELAHPDAIVITHHAGFGTDGMTSSTSTVFTKAFEPYHFPSATIDRIKFDSVPNYYTKYVGVSMMAFKWQDTMLSILNNVTAKAYLTIEKSYNPTTRIISGNVNVNFLTAVDSGDFRINLYVVEDSVVGDTGNYKYDQKNNTINDNTYPELYGKTKIEGYVHRNVVRDAPLGDWGQAGIIPSAPLTNHVYAAPFNYTLPQKYDNDKGRTVYPRQIKLMGFVSYYDNDTWKRKILNSVMVSLTDGTTSVNEMSDANSCKIYPNPANGFAKLDFKVNTAETVTIELFDMDGKKTAVLLNDYLVNGSYSLDINTSIIEQGTYICIIKTPESVITKRLIIIH